MNAPASHPYALLTPWYATDARRPRPFPSFSHRPVLQKYESLDFVKQLLADPTMYVPFADPDDRWSYPIAVPFTSRLANEKLRSHRMITTRLRKLYQPNHGRHYAVAIELFCDEAGYPRPSSTRGLEVGFVMRRIDLQVTNTPLEIAALAVEITKSRLGGSDFGVALKDITEDAAEQERLVATIGLTGGNVEVEMTRTEQAWVQRPGTPGEWQNIQPGDHLADNEEFLPMWAIPSRRDACAAARTRSLWFGVVPTFSGDMDKIGHPKLDDTSIYVLRTAVRVPPPRGHEHCPPHVYVSDATEPFRLAAFFDPQGTKNRRSHIKMPDLRALAATGGPGGGVTIETPPGSKLTPKGDGNMPSGKIEIEAPGDNCSFAIELFTIVAMFLFSLFLPIVTFVFQLWWMLLLKFCWPSDNDAQAQLTAYFAPFGSHPVPINTGSNHQGDEFNSGVSYADSQAWTSPTIEPQLPAPGILQASLSDPLC